MPELKLRLTSAREAALAILASRFGYEPVNTTLPLSRFQIEGATRIREILATHGLALLCDSVGLGKTFTALAVMEGALNAGQRVCLVIPASLKRMWKRTLRELPHVGGSLVLVSHSALGLGHLPAGAFSLVVVDEAHAFRNPKTRRYRALRRLCASAEVLLITATPVNNSLSDLYFLLRLRCPDGALRALGIGSLRSALRASVPRPDDLARLRRALVVRRTRADVGTEPGDPFCFPQHVRLSAVAYDLPLPIDQIAQRLTDLSFVGYQLSPRGEFSPELLRLGMLKRFESSRQAIAATLERQIRFYEQLVVSLAHGRALSPPLFRSLFRASEAAVQLVLEEVTLENTTSRSAALQHDAERELMKLRAWFNALPTCDAKLERLRHLLGERSTSKTIVFTEYRDTARYLWRALRRRYAVGLIDGAGAWIGEGTARRQDVVERFAPIANGARIHPREAIQVLIATDVLAEGMNLQDANAVISFDLPWNPVKLIQRAGRVDRLGSTHDVVEVYNFIPDREFDVFLGLAKKLRSKIATVRQTVGLEQPVLDPEEEFDLLFERLARETPEVVRTPAGPDQLAQRLRAKFESPATGAGIPCGSLAASGSGRILVGLSCAADWELIVFDPGLSSFAQADGTRYLETALDSAVIRPVDEQAVRTGIHRALALVRSRSALIGSGARRDNLAVAAERVRQAVSELPFESQDLYTEAEAVLSLLQQPACEPTERAVAEVLTQRHRSTGMFLQRLHRALESKKSACETLEWRVTGVLVLD